LGCAPLSNRKGSRREFLLLIAALLPAFAVGCESSAPYKKVHLNAGGEGAATAPFQPGKTTLRVAMAAVISPKETLRTYNQLLDYLGAKLGRPVLLVQRATYAEINELLRSGNADLAFVCSEAYVRGNRDFGMEMLVAPQVRGEALYRSYIIVPLDSTAQEVADLRGRTFAFTDPLSNSGHLAPTYLLWQMGTTPEAFFSKYVFTYSHDNSIKAVAEKLVDAAAVDSLVYDYSIARDPRYRGKTRVIWKSPPYGSPPVVVHPALDPELKSRLRDLFLKMNEDAEGRAVLSDLMIDRFVIPDDRAYEAIREMDSKLRLQSEGK